MTWSKLWAPKYILEITVPTASTTHMNNNILFFPVPMKSESKGSYIENTINECPLGLPKSIGQNHYRISIDLSYQNGLDYWKACFNTTMIYKPAIR